MLLAVETSCCTELSSTCIGGISRSRTRSSDFSWNGRLLRSGSSASEQLTVTSYAIPLNKLDSQTADQTVNVVVTS